ncbi:uncharacterized protein LOC120276736 isoform X1 [Dioscorea cayenensis subsp. rotundata]|uniref:Uncharacterized protein LOC120276736 isoform X1 n=1 Tax=Dioscorea cayennensis subsp. rotundata TaxID=55577 RepID=A0AB40CMA5_DIOCR|nr:uncharacterized protein LOC120276736 isoform X1 [Dioscorea cayenensis subsp. rotundata]XP_039139360.1 uncharacterized protein LOC120276736 isoform X1 [Dioscorea cayenensis subsp. rotundata]
MALMATNNEEEEQQQRQTLIAPIPQSLIFGLGLGFLCLSRSQSLSTGIKLADGAFKASKVIPKFQLQSPTSPHSILTASKAIIKAYKLSSCLKPTHSSPRITLPISSKWIKAYLGAANLIRYARHGFMGLGFLNGGYKISKNLVKVLEGFGALELDAVTRNGLKSLGLGVKTAIVLGEIELLVSIRQWRRSRCRFVRDKGLRLFLLDGVETACVLITLQSEVCPVLG